MRRSGKKANFCGFLILQLPALEGEERGGGGRWEVWRNCELNGGMGEQGAQERGIRIAKTLKLLSSCEDRDTGDRVVGFE